MPTSIDENKAAMRQTETPLNKSGGAAQKVKPLVNTGERDQYPPSLGIHGAPYTNRQPDKK